MGKLVIDGNAVYEVDEECLKTRSVPKRCKVQEAIERMESGGVRQSWQNKTRTDIKK